MTRTDDHAPFGVLITRATRRSFPKWEGAAFFFVHVLCGTVTRAAIPAQPGVEVHNQLQANSAALLAVYQSCDLFVLPSKAEAFGIAAVEASAAGLPVIAAAIDGLQEIVVNGETGFLIPPEDGAALADHLGRMLADPRLRRRLGRAARRRAETCFDARQFAGRIVEILETVRVEGRS